MAGCSFSTGIQNASKFNSACFTFSILSLAMLTSSSSSFKVNCPWHGSNSTNAFLTQLYWSTDIDGTYLLRLFNWESMVISALFLFSYWPPAEPLPGAHGTLRLRGTPVEKHWTTHSLITLQRKLQTFLYWLEFNYHWADLLFVLHILTFLSLTWFCKMLLYRFCSSVDDIITFIVIVIIMWIIQETVLEVFESPVCTFACILSTVFYIWLVL